MPSRNRVKVYLPDSFYHVYHRGINKRKIFKDDYDFSVFLNLLKRYLDSTPTKDNKGREYESLSNRLELLAFCLMPSHFHLLIYQQDTQAMTRLLRGVSIAYSAYFNKRHRRIGPLFSDRFRARSIDEDNYLQHISRYIHLNPPNYQRWEFSSLPYYLGIKEAGWVRPRRILELFEQGEYEKFVADYEDHKRMLDDIKHKLAEDSTL